MHLNDIQYDNTIFTIIPPSICETIKLCKSETELNILMVDLDVTEKQFVILFVNDATESGGGSHWSSLIFIKDKKLFHHVDTLKNKNTEHALMMARKLTKTLNMDKYQFINCDDHLENNSYDCGVYTIAHTTLTLEYLIQRRKRFSGFCLIHNKSSIIGLRKKDFRQSM